MTSEREWLEGLDERTHAERHQEFMTSSEGRSLNLVRGARIAPGVTISAGEIYCWVGHGREEWVSDDESFVVPDTYEYYRPRGGCPGCGVPPTAGPTNFDTHTGEWRYWHAQCFDDASYLEQQEAEAAVVQTDIQVSLSAAWQQGFGVGAEAGQRWFENGGDDSDDVNPYGLPPEEEKQALPPTRGRKEAAEWSVAYAGDCFEDCEDREEAEAIVANLSPRSNPQIMTRTVTPWRRA